ncbi:carboxypeptidase regulatory-like domain-containing protein [Pontibacter sp. JH31]|uniref:Carboxypeptidase regulatory-like domain-containing protein n=1 Tax=Pontibacter aquaedesilientis TaxID=2766980 RepID=A0ABR7XFN6_9BACT|nr:carboxypeptidase regulatory-like domain-containing protein [Pontibacter aquaedesilientis]MBD1397113.1 carboxypeptidase regulatory-like domain-containing protein [Pontibacter aquaedesilientis]
MKATPHLSHLILSFLAFWLITACTKEEEDYISKYCPGACTVVSGRIIKSGSLQPVAGMQVLASWKNLRHFKAGGGGTIRKKAIVSTDQQGNYTLRFLLRDEELQDGVLVISPLNGECPTSDCPSYTLYHDELKRDTTYTYDFQLP